VNCARAVNRELIQIHEPGCNHLSNSISNLFCALSSLKVRDQGYISTMSRVVEERKVIGQVLQFRKLPQFLGVGEVIQRNLGFEVFLWLVKRGAARGGWCFGEGYSTLTHAHLRTGSANGECNESPTSTSRKYL
jgi:hypothetical protein